MKNTIKILCVAVVALFTACNSGGGYSNENPKKEADSVSYAMGVQLGHSLKQGKDTVLNFAEVQKGINDVMKSKNTSYVIGTQIAAYLKSNGDTTINTSMLTRSIAEVMKNKKTLFSDDVSEEILMRHYNPQMYAEMKMNETKGETFLAENAKRPGVKTTASGLQYEVISEGNGPKPKPSDEVKVNYKGTLLDGTQFDASAAGKPVTFGVTQVIPGWTEGLQLMSVGSKYKFYIPSKLAYGKRGKRNQDGSGIGPNETLVFEVELVSAEEPKQQSQMSQEQMQQLLQQMQQQGGQK